MDRTELYEKLEDLKCKLNTDTLINEIFEYFSTDDMEDCLRDIDRNWDTHVFNTFENYDE